MNFKNIIVSSMIVASVIVAPVASFAQTPNGAQSTGDREDAVDKKAMDNTRMDAGTPGAATAPVPAETGETRGADSKIQGSTSGAMGDNTYKKGDIAPAPGDSENKTPTTAK